MKIDTGRMTRFVTRNHVIERITAWFMMPSRRLELLVDARVYG